VCQNLTMDRGGGVRYRLVSESGFPTSGFRTLDFRIRPFTLSPERVFVQGSGEAGSATVRLGDLGMAFLSGEWTHVRIPLESLGVNETSLSYLRIYSIQPASFYLDDLTMSTDVSQTILHLVSLLTTYVLARTRLMTSCQ
jgi:hypothetical protein